MALTFYGVDADTVHWLRNATSFGSLRCATSHVRDRQAIVLSDHRFSAILIAPTAHDAIQECSSPLP
jgi:hypothetical protein